MGRGGSTFLIFSNYMRAAMRLSALMELPVIYIFSHDSIGLGEDGPTHQPVEQLAALRAIPAPTTRLGNVHMDFCYADYFGTPPTTGYETLLYDCMNGDASLFKRADNVELAWELMAPILDVWSALPASDFPNYAAGTWGPEAADVLLRNDGRQWKNIGR
jgi:hypothetical protein